MYTNQHSGH